MDYFNQEKTSFNLKFNLDGTDFEKAVLLAIYDIPYGQTKSYKEIAYLCKPPDAYRAVGNIRRNNKLPILVPYHIVVKYNRRLSNYNSGVINKKTFIN